MKSLATLPTTKVSRGATALQTRRPLTCGARERPFNQRISLPSAKEATAFDDESCADLAPIDEDDLAVARAGVKKSSYNVVAMEERRALRSRKRAEEGMSP